MTVLTMFSIIIPLYNKSTYIEKAINSVLNQTYKEFELIIIDDGSTDDGLQIIKKLHNTLSHPFGGWRIVEQANSGVSTTRNNGVKLAKYDYIAFLDADDWWAHNYLEEMKELIFQYPEAGMYGSSYYKVKNGKYIPADIVVSNGYKNGLINYFQVYAKTLWMPIWTGATIIKKEIFTKENGFKPALRLGEDFDLWIRIAEKHSIAFLNKPLAYYNQDIDQTNRAIGLKLYEPEEHVLFQDFSQIKNNDFCLLYEKLALYGFLPYYAAGKNLQEIYSIIKKFDWKRHPFKYKLYYQILPRFIYQFIYWLQCRGSIMKNAILKKNNKFTR